MLNRFKRSCGYVMFGFILGYAFALCMKDVFSIVSKKSSTSGGAQYRHNLPTPLWSLVQENGEREKFDDLQARFRVLEGKLHELEKRQDDSLSQVHVDFEDNKAVAEEETLHRDEDDYSVANNLYRKVRVLCWVLTQPANLEKRARHVRDTWGRRCHKLLFFSSTANNTFPTIGLNITYEARSQLNRKSTRAFKYVYDHYVGDYDWFLKTDDDAYVIMENLRYFLSEQDPDGVYYFGHHFKPYIPGGYFSGGPGIVMGREALRRYGAALNNGSFCYQGESPGGADAEISRCLTKVGIHPGNSTDRLGHSRFHCFKPGDHIMKHYPEWYYKYDANGAHWGQESMSDYAIGFHYVTDVHMHELEYFIYHLRPYGVKFADKDLNKK